MKIRVINLETTGHSPAECHAYDCNCMVERVKKIDADGLGVEFNTESEHDDSRCECGYEVNDAHEAGSLELDIASPDAITNQALYKGLIPDYINESVEFDQLIFESSSDTSILVKDLVTSEPLYELRWDA